MEALVLWKGVVVGYADLVRSSVQATTGSSPIFSETSESDQKMVISWWCYWWAGHPCAEEKMELLVRNRALEIENSAAPPVQARK